MAKSTKAVEEVEEEETERYYVIENCTFNITIEDGGTMIVQSGSPVPFPPPK